MQHKKILSKQTIGDRVRDRRRAQDLTQRELATKVGLSPAAIGRMEAERDYVTTRPTITALAHALYCDPDWLETGTGEMYGSQKSTEEVVSDDRKLKVFADSLPKEVREAMTEESLAGDHYLTMEYLLENALKTRQPLNGLEEEADFQNMLRKWGRKRERGRAAIFHGIAFLKAVANLNLYEHVKKSPTAIAKRSDQQ